MAQEEAVVTIRDGDVEARVCPGVGGTLFGLTWRGFQVLRPGTPAALAEKDPRGMACFPMVPYCGRIANGRFVHDKVERRLALNFLPQPHAIHGVGWRKPWRVQRQDERSVTLALDWDPQADGAEHWPWRFRAEQRFQVKGDSFAAGISITNTGTAPFPAGIGLHPYFTRTPDVVLTALATGLWDQDQTLKPTRHIDLPAQYSFPEGLAMDQVRFDKCLTGWNGRARIDWPQAQVRATLTSPGTRHLVVYTPQAPAIMCVEPQSHVPDAINLHARGHRDTGHTVLAPDKTLALPMSLAFTRP